MFKRENTVQLEITYKELQMLRRYLLIWRNKLLAQGHITDPVDELLAEKRIDLHTSAVAVQWPMFFYPGGGLKMRKRVICGTAAAATVIGVLLWRWWRK